MDSRAIDFLSQVDLGTRVVVRYRIEGGFTDALGVLHSRTPSHCVIDTKRGLTTVAFGEVVLAKKVPPPPERRQPIQRHEGTETPLSPAQRERERPGSPAR